jgi:hypothetical protein
LPLGARLGPRADDPPPRGAFSSVRIYGSQQLRSATKGLAGLPKPDPALRRLERTVKLAPPHKERFALSGTPSAVQHDIVERVDIPPSERSEPFGARGARARAPLARAERAERAMLAAGLLLPTVYSVVPPPQTEPLLPRWTPTYNMRESTVVMPCNFSGTHSDAVRH